MLIPVIFAGKLLDPTIIVLAVVVGLSSRNWWHVWIGATIVACLSEYVLNSYQSIRAFDPLIILVIAAAGVWSSGGYAVKRWLKARRSFR